MDEALRALAEDIRAAMPSSIELPAGAGKTQLVAALAAAAAERTERPLVLTHTNAGVEALRRRLRSFGVASGAVRVATIASWSFDLVRHYPQLSGLMVAPEPDWRQSDAYYHGATAAVRAEWIRKVLQASYACVIVDEYQDCTIEQHDLMLGLAEAVPVCVFGDPLQNVFNFGGNTTVRWHSHVTTTWPAYKVAIKAWRWEGHNELLGQWLIDIRADLSAGQPIDLTGAPVVWAQTSSADPSAAAVSVCLTQAQQAGSIVAIDKWPTTCATVASRTNGAYGMMEELEGKFMMDFAAVIDAGDPAHIAPGTLKFAKECISKIAGLLNPVVATKLAKGQSVSHLRRPGAEQALTLLSGLLTDAAPARVLETLETIAELPGGRIYRREAWRDTLKALKVVSAGGDVTLRQALTHVRNRARVVGRAAEPRVVSRPLLIKGLEYDHAIVLNADRLSATELYVALSRGRKSLTIVSNSRVLRPGPPSL